MKKIILFMSLLLIIACSSDEKFSPTVVDTNYSIMLKDIKGNNLLDPTYDGSFSHQKIVLYEADANGQNTAVIYRKGSEIIRSVSIEGKTEYYIEIQGGSYIAPDRYIVYLFLPNGDLDKLEMKFKKKGHSTLKYEVYYNSKLIWREGDIDLGFVIIK